MATAGDDIVICQFHSHESFSVPSPALSQFARRRVEDPIELPTEDARRVFSDQHADGRTATGIFLSITSVPIRSAISVRPCTLAVPMAMSRIVGMISPDGAQSRRCVATSNDDGYADIVACELCRKTSVSLDPGSFVFLNGKDGFSHDPSWILPTSRGARCVLRGPQSRRLSRSDLRRLGQPGVAGFLRQRPGLRYGKSRSD